MYALNRIISKMSTFKKERKKNPQCHNEDQQFCKKINYFFN